MSTALAGDATLPVLGGRHHFLLRRLHSLTGIVFGGYLVIHLLVNATIIQGANPDVYQGQVNKIHSLPFLLAVEWLVIFLPIIYHALYGIWITFTAQPNQFQYSYTKNWFYFWQRVSAMVIVAFLLFHVLGMKGFFGARFEFDPHQATATAVRHIRANAFVEYFVYPIGVLASCYHLANGFWTAAITWGLTVSAKAQRRWGIVCALLFVFTLVCGLLAIVAIARHA